MYIVSKHYGFVLVFEDEEQLSRVVEHLQGMLEETRKDLIKKPYLYSLYCSNEIISETEMEKELKKLKKRLS